ncbi:MAG: PSD1 and planctomycete cytochrome C domain-containing protein [Planctomycetaceae bacterium]
MAVAEWWSGRIFLCLCLVCCGAVSGADEPQFGRDILPLLSDRCFACHGPDPSQRKADLRLDTREGATAKVIVPGDVGGSELMQRLTTADADLQMPPAESHKPMLTAAEVAMFAEWIRAGALWGRHWSFERPVKAEVPAGLHPVDVLIDRRLERAGVRAGAAAADYVQLRRVSFDLTGLPPTVADLSSNLTYEQHVDRLLAAPHFGERMAMWWLDAARYADTDGFQSDASRDNWPWRDWVVEAFNSNQRFDQFTLEQFAGDLLPNATAEQRLATCFHRNHMTNGEGGRDPEESRVDYVLDRVNTMGTLYLGLTLNCCQCHSHKFDPLTQRDYYGLTAFFNSIDEDGKAGRAAKPYLAYESRHVQRAVEEAERLVSVRRDREQRARAESEQPFADWLAGQRTELGAGYSSWSVLRGELESVEGTTLHQESDGVVQASGANPRQDDYRLSGVVGLGRVTGVRLEIYPHASHTSGGFSRGRTGDFILTDIKVQVRRRGSSVVRDIVVSGAVADFSPAQKDARSYGDIRGVLDDDPRNGWTTRGAPTVVSHVAVFELAEPVELSGSEELVFELRQRSTDGDANVGRFRVLVTDQAGPAVRGTGKTPLEELSEISGEAVSELRDRLREQFLADFGPYQEARRSLVTAESQLREVQGAKRVEVMVLGERAEARPTHVLERGVWDRPGELVQRGGLAEIAPLSGGELTRVDLARWLTSPEHPLTARVLVNHLWQLCFGAGLVRTMEDFGVQGERPDQAELLDWLAVECVESGWDVKHLLRLIVTSAAYRRSSAVSAEALELDPENRLYARGSRFRLPSWMLRDAALQAAGLLNPALGGPPVRPWQPAGVWEENFMGRFTWVPSEGAARYRRTLYAFWRRSIAPTFLFDSAQRRSCEVRSIRTNTPLQALTLLNDENYLEAARALAYRAVVHPEPFQELSLRVLSRRLAAAELRVLQREYERALSYYGEHPESVRQFLGTAVVDHAEGAVVSSESGAATAAYAVVASLLLNLDEAVTHE